MKTPNLDKQGCAEDVVARSDFQYRTDKEYFLSACEPVSLVWLTPGFTSYPAGT